MTIQQHTTIFYVDDDPDDREFFNEVTSTIGKEISLFELGDDMLLQLDNPPPHPSVIFLDLNMPVKDGFDVLKEIRETKNFNHVPVIILSTTSHHETAQRCLDLGASLYITKSPSWDALHKSVKYALDIDWQTRKISTENFIYKG